MVIEKNFNCLSDRGLNEYIVKYNLAVGKYYSSGLGRPLRLIGFTKDAYSCFLVFDDKTKYSISHVFWWKQTKRPYNRKSKTIDTNAGKKDFDKEYYYLTSRHRILCDKKLELNRQDKSTLMRNAYINQELDCIRTKLSEYKRII